MLFRAIPLIALSTTGAIAQAPPVVATQTGTTVVWTAGSDNSDQLLRRGLVVRILVKDGLAVSASLARNNDVLWANVSVTNASGGRVDVDPSLFMLSEVSPKQKELRYEAPDAIVKFIKRRADWANAFSAMAAESSRDKTTTDAEIDTKSKSTTDFEFDTRPHRYSIRGTAETTGSSHTTATVTTTSPDYDARMQAARTIEKNTAAADLKSEDILKRALLANTLMPGEEVSGAVFFERDKKAQDAILRVPIAGIVFEFPLSIR